MMVYDTIIIGGGPAAMSAALYLSRFSRKVAWIFGYGLGGQIQNTESVENYLGFNDKLAPLLIKQFSKQTEELDGVEKVFGFAIDVRKDKGTGLFKAQTDMGEVYKAKTILVASGAEPRKLDVPGEEDFAGLGVSYCAICDAPMFQGKTVAIVGGGQTAFEDAQILAKQAEKVILIHRRSEFRATDREVELVKATPNIEFMLDARIAEIKGDTNVERIIVENKNGATEVKVDGVFVAIGQVPRTEFLENLNEEYIQNESEPLLAKIFPLLKDGYIYTCENESMVIDGLFAAGDVVLHNHKQIAIAVGDGASAAININKYLQDKE